MAKRLVVICLSLLLVERIASLVYAQGTPELVGQWQATQALPFTPVQAAVLPSGNVFFWDQYEKADRPYVWDFQTSAVTPATPAGYNIFCTGFCLLANGRLFLAGGHIADDYGLATAAEYDPSGNSWTRRSDMNAGRWYPTAMALPNGDVLVVSGTMDKTSGMNLLPQVWQAGTSSWRSLTSAQLQLPYYPYMFVAPNGRVFNAGPNQTTRYLDTNATGAWSVVANNNFGARNWGSSVMFEPGKVMLVGGSTCDPYNYSCQYVPTATAEVIDLNAPVPSWQYVASMARPRKQHNATILPDGTVLVTGGTASTAHDTQFSAVYEAELWNPVTNTWTTLASDSVYRGYHATALLLPDGRVWSGGGNIGGASVEIFSPPYLFRGARPTIESAPATATLGQTIFVQTPDASSITKVTLVRLGAVTHTFNQGQRFNNVAFTQAAGGLDVTLPSSATVAPVGHYMLFILNGTGVPSVATIFRLDPAQAPAAPTGLAATAASSGQIDLSWTDNTTDEDGFKLERCQGTGCTTFAQIATVAANVTTYPNTGLTTGTSYSYRVRAYNVAGDSTYSNTATAMTTSVTPGAPTSLTAAAASSTQINLAWIDNTTSEDGFKIERCQGTGCATFAQIATVAANVTTYANTALTPGISYSYRVRAYNVAGDSIYSNTATATTSSVTPGAPTSLTATAASSTRINLAWMDNTTSENGFKIERCQGTGCTTFAQIATVAANVTTYANTGLTAGTSYSYRVRAYNSGGDSGYSNTATTTTAAAPPATPTNLAARALSSTQINLTWTDSSANEDGFRIERSLKSNGSKFTQIAIVGPNVMSYSDSGLSASTTYYYRIAAYNAVGASAYSQRASATTLAGTAARLSDEPLAIGRVQHASQHRLGLQPRHQGPIQRGALPGDLHELVRLTVLSPDGSTYAGSVFRTTEANRHRAPYKSAGDAADAATVAARILLSAGNNASGGSALSGSASNNGVPDIVLEPHAIGLLASASRARRM